jgi:hypothetical protein
MMPVRLTDEQREQFEEQQAAAEKFMQAAGKMEVEHRRQILAWPMLFCSCRQHWRELGTGGPPVQQGCLVHGQFMISPTEVIM